MKKPVSWLFNKWRGLAKNVVVYIKIIKFMSTGSKFLFTTSFLANALISQIPVLMAFTNKLIIDSLVSKNSISHSLSEPVFYGSVFLFLLLFQNSGQLFLTFINENLTESIAKNLHLEIMKVSNRIEGLYYFENPEFHNRRAIVENTALYLPMNFLNFATDIYGITFVIIGMIALLFQLNPVIPFIMIIAGIPDIFTQKKAHRLFFEGIKETAEQERLKDYYRSILLTKEHAQEVRIYDLKNYFIKKYNEVQKGIFRIVLPIRKQQIKNSIVSGILVSLGTVFPYFWTIGKALEGSITTGQLVMFMTAIVVIQQQISRTAQTFAGHQDVISSMEELTKWIQMESDLITPKPEQSIKRISSIPPQVRIENLWFRYPGSETFVLKGFELELTKGKSFALVGRNGSGKTTLVKLLCRLFDPEQGKILFDGIDIRYLDINDLRTSFGIIFQDFMHYDLTVKENIAFSELDDLTISDRVHRAAKASNADEFVVNLPKKYDTLLGKRFPEGVELSHGQWQRLALARGFLRDAGLVILDEPTASLDVTTEAKIYSHFKTMTEGKTSLLISHRLSTVRMVNQIAVVDEGKVVELGDHDSLLSVGGLYAEMFTTQAERYRLKEEQMV